ncbi:hypothetical protein HDU86_007651 [Geranomyces michiganensis]|nr:hypothetical protein HDU86_007651 [Geranomyces michiganensis]
MALFFCLCVCYIALVSEFRPGVWRVRHGGDDDVVVDGGGGRGGGSGTSTPPPPLSLSRENPVPPGTLSKSAENDHDHGTSSVDVNALETMDLDGSARCSQDGLSDTETAGNDQSLALQADDPGDKNGDAGLQQLVDSTLAKANSSDSEQPPQPCIFGGDSARGTVDDVPYAGAGSEVADLRVEIAANETSAIENSNKAGADGERTNDDSASQERKQLQPSSPIVNQSFQSAGSPKPCERRTLTPERSNGGEIPGLEGMSSNANAQDRSKQVQIVGDEKVSGRMADSRRSPSCKSTPSQPASPEAASSLPVYQSPTECQRQPAHVSSRANSRNFEEPSPRLAKTAPAVPDVPSAEGQTLSDAHSAAAGCFGSYPERRASHDTAKTSVSANSRQNPLRASRLVTPLPAEPVTIATLAATGRPPPSDVKKCNDNSQQDSPQNSSSTKNVSLTRAPALPTLLPMQKPARMSDTSTPGRGRRQSETSTSEPAHKGSSSEPHKPPASKPEIVAPAVLPRGPAPPQRNAPTEGGKAPSQVKTRGTELFHPYIPNTRPSLRRSPAQAPPGVHLERWAHFLDNSCSQPSTLGYGKSKECFTGDGDSKGNGDTRASVIIHNLNPDITKDDVKALCTQLIGPVVGVRLKTDDKGTRARVIFVSEESIEKAISELDDREADGEKEETVRMLFSLLVVTDIYFAGKPIKVTLFPPPRSRAQPIPALPMPPATALDGRPKPVLDSACATAISKWNKFTEKTAEFHPAVANDKIGDGLLHRMGPNLCVTSLKDILPALDGELTVLLSILLQPPPFAFTPQLVFGL